MKVLDLVSLLVLVGFCADGIRAISNRDHIDQNTITEDERRGAPAGDIKNHKLEAEKNTRGVHSSSASQKHQQYYYPSAYDSHVAPTGHSISSLGSLGVGGGGGTTGYAYSGHTGHSLPTASGGHHSHGSTAFGTPTAYGGYSGYSGITGGAGGHKGQTPISVYGGYSGGHTLQTTSSHGIQSPHGGGYNSALALKGLLIPLAGIALIGAAAALTTNPVLLQLGVLNGRRKRSIAQQYHKYYPTNPHVIPDNKQ